MAERRSYAHGIPSYVDLGAPDVGRAAAFYSALFGWDFAAVGPAEETGGYQQAMLRGKVVAGLGPAQDPGPPRWSTYVTVDDVDKAAAAATGAGGSVLVEPMDVLTAGRMAVVADPTGAVFAVWQAGDAIGSELVNEPGTLCWNELQSRNIDAVRAFYTAVFGWGYKGEPDEYVEFTVGGGPVGGMLPTPEAVPAEVPDHWLVYFAVDSYEAAVATVTDLGGTVQAADLSAEGVGRFAVVADDQGATFCVIELENPGS